jgi:hypothetical protein
VPSFGQTCPLKNGFGVKMISFFYIIREREREREREFEFTWEIGGICLRRLTPVLTIAIHYPFSDEMSSILLWFVFYVAQHGIYCPP